jgi:hypothetical protein
MIKKYISERESWDHINWFNPFVGIGWPSAVWTLFKMIMNNDGQQFHQYQQMRNHLSPQTIEHKKNHDIWHWKSRSWLMWSQYIPLTVDLTTIVLTERGHVSVGRNCKFSIFMHSISIN